MRSFRIFVAAAVAFSATSAAGTVQTPSTAPLVQCSSRGLTVRLQDVGLAQVVKEVARRCGAAVVGRIDDDARVSGSFDDQPVDAALRRLLGGRSFLLSFAGDGRLTRVVLLTSGDEALPAGGGKAIAWQSVASSPPPAAAPDLEAPPPAMPRSPAELGEVFAAATSRRRSGEGDAGDDRAADAGSAPDEQTPDELSPEADDLLTLLGVSPGSIDERLKGATLLAMGVPEDEIPSDAYLVRLGPDDGPPGDAPPVDDAPSADDRRGR